MSMHADELEISTATVRRLVDRDLPEHRHRPLRRLGESGSSNALFRLGDELLVRLPRQPGGSASIEKEIRWLPSIGPRLPVAVPEHRGCGRPGFGYPERWAVTGWIEGHRPSAPSTGLARDLADVVLALRAAPVPAAALEDPRLHWYRGGDLHDIDAEIRDYLARCRDITGLGLDLRACRRIWDDAMALPRTADIPPTWLHGDLLAENLLVRDGRLTAVLDFGGLALGRPDVDLIVAWEVLSARGREEFRSALEVDDPAWQRGRAWALAVAVMTFPCYWHSMPERCAARLAMARAVLADHAATG